MLASITPLGERGRQSRWGLTMTAFALAAGAAGAAAGALAGALGGLAIGPVLGTRGRLAMLALALLAAALVDLLPGAAPGPRRQVNERWLDEFRGWVYGAGFGAQLGLGATTVVASAATYVALVAAALSASPASCAGSRRSWPRGCTRPGRCSSCTGASPPGSPARAGRRSPCSPSPRCWLERP